MSQLIVMHHNKIILIILVMDQMAHQQPLLSQQPQQNIQEIHDKPDLPQQQVLPISEQNNHKIIALFEQLSNHPNEQININPQISYLSPSPNYSQINSPFKSSSAKNKISNTQQYDSNEEKSYATQNLLYSTPEQQGNNIIQCASEINGKYFSRKKKKLPTIDICKDKDKNNFFTDNNEHQTKDIKASHKFKINKIPIQKSPPTFPNIQNQNISIEVQKMCIMQLNSDAKDINLSHQSNQAKKQQNKQTMSSGQVLNNSRSIGVGNRKITKQDLQISKYSNSEDDENNKDNQQIIDNKQINNNQKQSQSKVFQQYQNKLSQPIIIQLEKRASNQNGQNPQITINNEQELPSSDQLLLIQSQLKNNKEQTHNHKQISEDLQPITNDNQRWGQKESLRRQQLDKINNHNRSNILEITQINNKQSINGNIKEKESSSQRKSPNGYSSSQQQFQEKSHLKENLFNLKSYAKIYDILKSIQNILKNPVINAKQLSLFIKKYLQIIAMGHLDRIDQFDLLAHKKKIVKSSLLFQRLAVIILAFAFATHTLKESLKYLINIIGFSMANCLILLKIMQQTQIIRADGKERTSSRTINEILQKSDRFAMNKNLQILKNNNNTINDTIYKLTKVQQNFHENIKQIIKQLHKSSLQQVFYTFLQYFAYYLCFIQRDYMIPYLAIAPNPYLSLSNKTTRYCLVIDCIQVFCHTIKKSKTNIFRPYAQHFLNQMDRYFQIISYCSVLPNQIDKTIDALDPKGLIEHRLYRHHTINNNGRQLKCLDRLGRNDDEIILLDRESFGGANSRQHCINVPPWKGMKNDTILAELCPLLAMITLKKIPAREAVKRIREQAQENKKLGVKYMNFGVLLR